jgi:small subunit ribosomal protein S1
VRTGKVIGVRGKSLFVELGGKSEGVLPVEQFEGAEIPAPGSTIEVVVDRFDPDEGVQILRLKGTAIEANWENLKRGVVVEARVTKVVKGGAEVDVDGIRGFLPISQIDLSRVEDASAYVNQRFKAIVTEANQRERNLVISRRELLEQERAEQREKTWKALEEGQTREGVVRSVKDFGAFVDIGGVDGLLPIGEMSWSRVAKVDDLVKTGDKVTVKVLKIDQTARKLTLGLKQLTPSPWEGVADKYPRGTMVKGKVTRTMDFGAFVELEPGVEGLVHISELSPTRVRRVADIVKPAQEVEVRILKVEPELKKISLSLLPDPRKADAAAVSEEEPEDETPPAPKPERKVPLKGGLGDRERAN